MKTNKKILARLIGVELVITLLPSMALADDPVSYNLWVGGKQVTSENAGNITSGEGIILGEDGYVRYDATSNTLELKNATITGSSDIDITDWKANIYAAGKLNVSFSGTNVVSGDKDKANIAIYSSDGDISVTGSGSLKAEGTTTGILTYEKGITIKDCAGLTATGSGNTGIYGYAGVTIENISQIILQRIGTPFFDNICPSLQTGRPITLKKSPSMARTNSAPLP